jgi:peptidoglycan endopeptidase LytE
MHNRNRKRLAMLMAVAFALMPLPEMTEAMSANALPNRSVIAVPTMHTSVERAGVAINGKMVSAVDPIRIKGLYFVPFKQIAHILNYEDIRYNHAKKTYTATDGSVTVRVTIGSSRAAKGDETVNIVPPRFINGTAYLSLDAVSAVFNVFAYFKADNGSVQVQMPARQYRVHAGDTLYEIAQAHHTTVEAVRSANGLRTDMLVIGQVLRLPAEALTREMEPARESITQTPVPQRMTTPVQGSTAEAKAQAIIATGKKYLGAPYKFGVKLSEAPRVMDCSSFMQYIFKKHGILLPRDSRQQSREGTYVRKSDLKPGDLVFFKYPERYSDGRVGHVGLYIGNGQMLHTVPKTGVTITNMNKSKYWTRNYLFGRRVIR